MQATGYLGSWLWGTGEVDTHRRGCCSGSAFRLVSGRSYGEQL